MVTPEYIKLSESTQLTVSFSTVTSLSSQYKFQKPLPFLERISSGKAFASNPIAVTITFASFIAVNSSTSGTFNISTIGVLSTAPSLLIIKSTSVTFISITSAITELSNPSLYKPTTIASTLFSSRLNVGAISGMKVDAASGDIFILSDESIAAVLPFIDISSALAVGIRLLKMSNGKTNGRSMLLFSPVMSTK